MLRPNPPEPPRRTLLRRADQAAIAAVALFVVAMIGGYWWSQVVLRHRLIDLERADPRTAAFQVDINTAAWPELAQLPGLGETLAQRIVRWRTDHGRFQSLDQLRHVSGIGPKRLESIRSYLRPPEKDAPVAEATQLHPVKADPPANSKQ